MDELVPCSGPLTGGSWKNHGAYVSAIAHAAHDFVAQGLISGSEKGAIVSKAAQSDGGKKQPKPRAQPPSKTAERQPKHR